MSGKAVKHKLEDYQPGATKAEVFEALRKVATATPKTKKKSGKPFEFLRVGFENADGKVIRWKVAGHFPERA